MELYLCVNLCFVLFDIYILAVSLEDLKFETIAFTRNPNEFFLGEKKKGFWTKPSPNGLHIFGHKCTTQATLSVLGVTNLYPGL